PPSDLRAPAEGEYAPHSPPTPGPPPRRAAGALPRPPCQEARPPARGGRRPAFSCQDLPQRLGTGVDQANGPADAGHVLAHRIQARRETIRPEQVGRAALPLLDGLSAGAGATDDLTAADATPAEYDAPRRRVVVAALARVDGRRAAE